ncbi:Uncharacterised protein, partial [Mycoplasma putrefaciens]
MKNKVSKEIKQNRIDDRKAHNKEVEQKIQAVYDNYSYHSKVLEYNQLKKLRW